MSDDSDNQSHKVDLLATVHIMLRINAPLMWSRLLWSGVLSPVPRKERLLWPGLLWPELLKAIFVWLLLCFASPASARTAPDIKIAKSPWCPYVCNSNESGFSGYITETIETILTEQNYRIDYVELNFARGIQLVEQGKLDLVLSIFKAESDTLITNKIPVVFSHNYFFTLADSGWHYSTRQSFQQMRLGAIQGYDYLDDALNQHIRLWQSQSVTLVSGEHPQQRLIQLLKLDRIDTFLDDLVVVKHELKKFPSNLHLRVAGQTRGPEPVYIAVSPHLSSADTLIKVIDDGLRRRDAEDALIEIANRYQIYIQRNPMGNQHPDIHNAIVAPELRHQPLTSAALSTKE